MSNVKSGKGFSEQSERISEAGKKGNGAVNGNLKRDPGRATEAGHRSNEERQGHNTAKS